MILFIFMFNLPGSSGLMAVADPVMLVKVLCSNENDFIVSLIEI